MMNTEDKFTRVGGLVLFTPSAITATLAVLKFLHVLNWSWIWVLSPVWIPIWILLIAITIGFMFAS